MKILIFNKSSKILINDITEVAQKTITKPAPVATPPPPVLNPMIPGPPRFPVQPARPVHPIQPHPLQPIQPIANVFATPTPRPSDVGNNGHGHHNQRKILKKML